MKAAALAAAMCLAAGVARAAAPDLWFGLPQPRPDVDARLHADPRADPALTSILDHAQTDWERLFAPGMLETIAPPMQVAEITTGFLLAMPADQLSDRLGRVVARGAALAYVAQPVVTDQPGCGHEEGYENPAVLADAIERLKRMALPIRYLELDGGLFAGHYSTDGQACRLTMEQTVRQVALTVNAVKAVFPDVVVGEIMPTVALTRQPDWQQGVRAYRDGLTQATGKTLAFFMADVAWEDPGWRQSLVAEAALARSLGVRFGYICNGLGADPTDAAWLARARSNAAEIEGPLGIVPDQVSFDSWNTHPAHAVGAPGDETLASLMLWYAARHAGPNSDGRSR